MYFSDKNHEERFNSLIRKDKSRDYDYERKAFFYIISAFDKLYNDDLYDFEERVVKLYYKDKEFENVVEVNPNYSSSEEIFALFAFHLFNSIYGEYATFTRVFRYGGNLSLIALTAIAIRFNLPLS